MNQRIVACVFAVVLLAATGTARASSIFLNNSFETGNFTGWIATDLSVPFFPLSVQGSGANTLGWPWSSTPTDGSFTAFSGFDGAGPGNIELAQDVTISAGNEQIMFDWRAAWDLFTFGATQHRVFDVAVQASGGGADQFTQNILTALAGTVNTDTGSQTSIVDLSSFSGQLVRVVFRLNVPESFTGPAQFQLDNIQSGPGVAPVPEPASLLLLGGGLAALGYRRYRRN